MPDKFINCPECNAEIEISTVLAQQIEEDLKNSLQQAHEQKLRKAVEAAEQKSQQGFSLEMQALQDQLKEQQGKLSQAREKELDLKKQARDLESKREQLEDEITKRLKEKEQALRDQISKQSKQQNELAMQDLKEQLKERDEKVVEAQRLELDLRKQHRQLEDKQKSLDLEFQRKLDEERHALEDKLGKQFSEEANLKLLEKEKQIADLRKSLDDAKRKSEQGSMETQGEVLELDLEQRLMARFPHDLVAPVPKGIKGADVIQTIIDPAQADCGKIIWEAKNTKNWSSLWLQKLKDEQRNIGANVAILVSVSLPDGIRGFGLIDGVWVTDLQSYLPLAEAIREQLIQVNFARNASHGKSEKMEVMFNYLSGDEFRQRVEAIVETFSTMHNQLHKEKRAMERIWKEREKQIERITSNTIGMYGDVRGIIGNSVQSIPALELDPYFDSDNDKTEQRPTLPGNDKN
jgi:hypothetical protein